MKEGDVEIILCTFFSAIAVLPLLVENQEMKNFAKNCGKNRHKWSDFRQLLPSKN